MKNLIYAGTALILIVASSVSAARATGRSGDGKISHLVNSAAYPNIATLQGATHQFEVHVQGNSLSELSIDLPQELSINNGIDVKNQFGQKVPATVSINKEKARVIFSQPIPPETKLSISMLGIETPGYDQIWQYRIYAKKVGLTAEIPLGIAQIQTYR
ncbi:DUF2808 domain-containing protein [Aerosakkonema funiforme]|uniref:DUF2808 domain-containing protein n=1 Tax=Aerosakkonema funiforme TaxID=1246630 RepID=UPI0035B9B719